MKVNLSLLREEILEVIDTRRDNGGPHGCYRWLPGSRTNLYASLDAAIAYCVMGIDSVHKLQMDDGRWYDGDAFSYLDMDALYAYVAMLKVSDNKRESVRKSALKYGTFLTDIINQKGIYDTITMHGLLALASSFGCLNQLMPDVFYDSVNWSDIFSARILYRTDLVESD